MVEQTYRVDMIPNGIPLVVHVSQYDTEARTLIFELYKGDVAYEVPAGAVASIAGTKPDKTAFIYPMAIDGNVVSIDLKQQMAIVAGDVLAEIQITNSSGKIGSANFVIRVERGPIDEDSVISETDLPIFEELVSDAQEAAADAQTAADTASAAASSVASIVPTSAGSAGQVLTRTANGADWQSLDGKANTSTLATVEVSSKASKTYAVGDYLVHNGILYRVTEAISTGQTLTPGTNISATNAGAELTSLNNGLTRKIGYVDIDLSETAVTRADSGWYYANVSVSLPTGARLFAVATLGSWDANTFYAIDGLTNGISIRSSTSKTLGSGKKARCFYYLT